MRINRIELKNFRNHREAAFEFEKGINLILGENGSGKTSILDAIGFALFNMKLRSDANETLTINESSGYVKIRFTGNDQNVYIVTRKFPATAVSLSEEGSRSSISGVTEVYRKINSLIGNPMDNQVLFENVIVASQNRFASIFDAKPSEREAVFNPVFGTEIYRQMYAGILKKRCDQYERELTFAGGELGASRSQLKDCEELEKNLQAAEKEYLISSGLYSKTAKMIEDTVKTIKNFESRKNLIENLSVKIKGLKAQIDDKRKLIDEIDSDLKTADSAALEEENLKPAHDEYEKIKSDLEKITGEIGELEKAENEYRVNSDMISKLEKELATAEGNRNTVSRQIESDTVTAASLRGEISSITASIDLLEKERIGYERELSSLQKRKSSFDRIYAEYKEADQNSVRNALLAAKAEESLIDEESLNAEIASFEREYAQLEVLKTERDRLRSEITRHKTLMSELSDAERELSKQVCPYLKEECRNIENMGSVNGYFRPKKDQIIRKIESFEKDSASYDDLDERIKNCVKNRSTKNEQLAALGKNRRDALNYRKNESACRQKKAEYALDIAKLFSGLAGEDAACVLDDDYNGASSVMQRTDAEYRTRLSGINGSVQEKRGECAKKENDLNRTALSVEAAGRKLEEIKKQISGTITDLKNRTEAGAAYEQRIAPLADKKKTSAGFTARLKELEPADRKYRSASQNAARRDGLRKRIENERIITDQLLKNCRLAEGELGSVVYNADDHMKLLSDHDRLKPELEEQNGRMMNCKSAFDLARQQSENNSRVARELEDKMLQVSGLSRKKEAADRFREDIKLLGPYISGRRTRMIAAAATANYQRMTGKAERILWENNAEQYLVSVSSPGGIRRFNMLSGGEQVAVALSIRSALASEMTDCRFAIFDEPTINLDAEKKEALSVSLYDMLRDLEQALVVTHDSSFREMAVKVIEL